MVPRRLRPAGRMLRAVVRRYNCGRLLVPRCKQTSFALLSRSTTARWQLMIATPSRTLPTVGPGASAPSALRGIPLTLLVFRNQCLSLHPHPLLRRQCFHCCRAPIPLRRRRQTSRSSPVHTRAVHTTSNGGLVASSLQTDKSMEFQQGLALCSSSTRAPTPPT